MKKLEGEEHFISEVTNQSSHQQDCMVGAAMYWLNPRTLNALACASPSLVVPFRPRAGGFWQDGIARLSNRCPEASRRRQTFAAVALTREALVGWAGGS